MWFASSRIQATQLVLVIDTSAIVLYREKGYQQTDKQTKTVPLFLLIVKKKTIKITYD